MNPRDKIPRKSKDSPAEARAYALKLLNYRSRSRREILDKLKRKGFEDTHIKNAIRFLEDTGLINDEELASQLFRYSLENKSLGKKGIIMLLARRGIDKEIIDRTILNHSVEMDVKTAEAFVKRRLNTLKNYPEEVIKRRLWGMLRRRGFSSNVIYKVIDKLPQD